MPVSKNVIFIAHLFLWSRSYSRKEWNGSGEDWALSEFGSGEEPQAPLCRKQEGPWRDNEGQPWGALSHHQEVSYPGKKKGTKLKQMAIHWSHACCLRHSLRAGSHGPHWAELWSETGRSGFHGFHDSMTLSKSYTFCSVSLLFCKMELIISIL